MVDASVARKDTQSVIKVSATRSTLTAKPTISKANVSNASWATTEINPGQALSADRRN